MDETIELLEDKNELKRHRVNKWLQTLCSKKKEPLSDKYTVD